MNDLISRQAAIEKIHWLGLDNDTTIMCDLAIRALSPVNTQEAKTSNSENPSEDAISRQAVLDVIAETDITNGTEPVFTGKQVQALLRDLPLVTPKQIGWIPVSERLPSSGKTEDYLACCSDGYISTIMYDADNGRWLIDGAEVVAWMPLPEPYKAESEE